MLHKVQRAFEQHSQQPAFVINKQSYTYTDFAQILSNVRHDIESRSLANKYKLVGVLANDDIETYATLYGIMFAGCAFVPINPKHPINRSGSAIVQAELTTIFVSKHDAYVQQLQNEYPHVQYVTTSQLLHTAINLTPPHTKPDDLAYLLFTSGSTGVAKGVPITCGNVNSFIDNFLALGYNIDHTDKFLQIADLTFDLSVISYMLPLCLGACVYTVPAQGIKYMNIYTLLEDDQLTFAIMVPSILTYLRPYFADIELPHLKYALFCGEALYTDVATEWTRCMPNGTIINTYGPTEATVLCTYYDFNPSEALSYNSVMCIGEALPNMEVSIADEQDNLLPHGETGEICLHGTQVTPGYWKNETKNAEAFFTIEQGGKTKKYYRTGDVGFYDENGYLFYAGRADFQVKIDGYRIELGEIEHHARVFTQLSNVTAVTYTDNIGTTRIHLFLENYNGDTQAITDYLRTKIAPYMIPSGISSLQHFPLNSNGKTDRKELAKILQNK